MLCHLLHYVVDSDVLRFINDTLVQVSNCILNYFELLKQFAACIEHFMTKHILLAIDPEVREALLSRI